MAWVRRLLFILSSLLLVWTVSAKISQGSFHVKGGGLHYLTKFGCSIGACPWELRLKLSKPWAGYSPKVDPRARSRNNNNSGTIKLRIFLDEEWEKSPVRKRPSCRDMSLARTTKTFSIPLDGSWSDLINGTVSQTIRPHVWYFVLDDCQGVVTRSVADAVKVKKDELDRIPFDWKMTMMQPNNSHFSYEMSGLFSLTIFHIFCYVGLAIFMGHRQVREMKRSGRLHTMIQLLNVAVLTQLSSSLLHFCHLLAYCYDGHGITILDGTAEALAVMSQIIMTSVLAFVALGYSLNVPNAASIVDNLGMPLVVVIAVFHILLVCLDRFSADPRFKFHPASGFLGYVLTAMRLALWLLFVLLSLRTCNDIGTPGPVAQFLKKFVPIASLYFLAYPLVFLVTNSFAPYLQYKVLSTGIFLMQILSMSWLCSLFLTRGQYFKISDLGQSYLPGGYLSSRGVHRLD